MPARLEITPQLSIDEDEFETSFVRASGPGGQNVNKVATAVQLRFDVRRSNSLPQEVKQRLLRLGGKRVSADGILLIEARRFRTQEQNRLDAVERFRQLVRRAAEPPRPRRRHNQHRPPGSGGWKPKGGGEKPNAPGRAGTWNPDRSVFSACWTSRGLAEMGTALRQ